MGRREGHLKRAKIAGGSCIARLLIRSIKASLEGGLAA
jgi:hypothetical protein